MRTFIRSHPLLLGGGVVAIAGLAWLAFGWFGVHTLFIDNRVDEAPPVFAATSSAPDTPEPTPTTADEGATEPPDADSPEPDETSGEVAPLDAEQPAGVTQAPNTAEPTEPVIVTERAGEFESLGRYSTSGRAVVLGDGSGQRFLRFEDFATDNGPDLNVYLVNSSVDGVVDFVDLGTLTGNIGSQNYEIDPGLDLSVYDTVMIWCVRFGVGFGQAPLMA